MNQTVGFFSSTAAPLFAMAADLKLSPGRHNTTSNKNSNGSGKQYRLPVVGSTVGAERGTASSAGNWPKIQLDPISVDRKPTVILFAASQMVLKRYLQLNKMIAATSSNAAFHYQAYI